MKNKTRTIGTYLVIIATAAITVFLCVFPSAAVEAVFPAERIKAFVVRSVWPRVSGFFSGAEAKAESARLRREVAALSLVRTEVERLEAENDRLRKVLGYSARRSGKWIAAAVLSEQGGAAAVRRTLRVDKGTLDGVAKGDVVAAASGLVGIVRSVTPHTAVVALVTDESVKVACEIEGGDEDDPVRGIAYGGNEDRLLLRHLTGRRAIMVRSRVVTSGLGGVFPKGLEVGRLHGVVDDGGLVNAASVMPSVDFDQLEDVFIRHEK